MEPIPDFSKRRRFPGTLDNEFDIFLRSVDRLEKIPFPLFLGLLFLIALLPTWQHWLWTAGLFLFFLSDWVLLSLLPRFNRSYGSPKPVTLILALLRMAFAFLPLPVALPLQFVGTLLVIVGFWIEPNRLTVTHQKLLTPKLKPGNPIRILHLGDLHVERITQREKQLQRLITELHPDLILFSGDVINLSFVEDPIAWQAARDILRQWTAPYGVYVVSGSPAVDLEHVFPHLVGDLSNLRWLREERITLDVHGQPVDILGLTCTHKPFIDGPKLEQLAAQSNGYFTILLYHTPDLAPNAANTGAIDLQLSGHTHGGQIRLPVLGSFFAGSLYGKRFEAGRYMLDKLTLYVTRGIGMEGKAAPRVRFFCPPEIILWEIDGK